MLQQIIKKEWTLLKRDKIATMLALILILLLVVALSVSVAYHNWFDNVQRYATAQARKHVEEQGVKNSHSAAHYGIYLFKPQNTLALWDNGIDKFYGVSLYIEAHKRNQMQFRAVDDNPVLGRWGELSPAYILLMLLPLLFLWLGNNSIFDDRQNATFKLISAQGVSLKQYVFGKALTLWMVASVLILLTWLVCGIVLSFLKKENFFFLPSLLLPAVYILYSGIFIHLGLAIGLVSKNGKAGMLAVLACWLGMVCIIPKFSTQISESFFPSPEKETFDKKISADIAVNGINGHGGMNEKKKNIQQQWLQKYKADSLKDLPLNFTGVELQADEDTNNVILNRYYDSLYAIYRLQQHVHLLSSIVSPFMPAKYASMSLSGTDLWSSIDFSNQADDYRKIFIRTLNNRLRDNSRYLGRDTATTAFWKTLPRFSYRLATAGFHIRKALLFFLPVIFWLLFSCWLTYRNKNFLRLTTVS